MTTTTFDTHAYVKCLKSVGFTEEQAEVFAEEQTKLIDEKLATKRDLLELEYRLTIKLSTMLCVSIGIVAALDKIL